MLGNNIWLKILFTHFNLKHRQDYILFKKKYSDNLLANYNYNRKLIFLSIKTFEKLKKISYFGKFIFN